MSGKKEKNYRDSLNLPKAEGFPMKAGLLQKEPVIQKKWEKTNLFSAVRKKSEGAEKFVLHDGPPYANGSIHIGHLLNKILKDMVVRSQTMLGFDSFLKPGWDCHGLPIEHKMLKESEEREAASSPMPIRKKCRNYADKFVRKQTKEMKRLGTMADYEKPYLTMNPQYEAGVLEVFAGLVGKGIVSRDKKPVHWSVENRTALAEAELEYHEKTDPSIYVLLPVKDPERLPKSLNVPQTGAVFLMVWTTTPWTLPANLAVAVSPDAGYGLYETDGKFCVVAENLAETVFSHSLDSKSPEKTGSCAGKDFLSAQTTYTHPFIEREGRVVGAPYVGTDEGTGLVHTAPGHGAEDYETGVREGLDIYCPVGEDGTFDSSAPQWLQGKSIWEGNGIVAEKLRELNLLFYVGKIVHSYPHDWRGKTPTIFRATSQWFIKMDKPFGEHGKTLREMALENVKEKINFHPEWGSKRLGGMLESRPDWCISRQRSWGLPIPAFTDKDGNILLTKKTVLIVAEKIRAKGGNFWFESEPPELLEGYNPENDANAPEWAKNSWNPSGLKKGTDIFDVWFESGSSWHSVIEKGEQGRADLYLEGSDQHRGWFQSSLLLSLAATGKPPFKDLLTHGFIVDAQGKKMSKSGGNALEVEEVLKKYGADVCRWWVSSLNYSNDIKADIKIIESAADEYRTIRNTIRFLLSNLNDFDPEKDSVELAEEDDYSIDNVALIYCKVTLAQTVTAYSEFEYRKASRAIIKLCDFLSMQYIVAVRDRLYCNKANSKKRRKTQTVIHKIADVLIKLCAPILVHTAEEAYGFLHEKEKDTAESVHLTGFLPKKEEVKKFILFKKEKEIIDTCLISSDFDLTKLKFLSRKETKVYGDWVHVLFLKDKCLVRLETAKTAKKPSNPLDAAIGIEVTDLSLDTNTYKSITRFKLDEIADLVGVSRLQIMDGRQEGGVNIRVNDLTNEPKCDRCWKRVETVSKRQDGGSLCDRCADAVGV